MIKFGLLFFDYFKLGTLRYFKCLLEYGIICAGRLA